MSWEEMSTSQTVCPCGKGKITQKSYGDDWNRYQDGPVIIECEECAKKYKVEEVMHRGMLTSDGSWSEYFLLLLHFFLSIVFREIRLSKLPHIFIYFFQVILI